MTGTDERLFRQVGSGYSAAPQVSAARLSQLPDLSYLLGRSAREPTRGSRAAFESMMPCSISAPFQPGLLRLEL